MAKSDGQENGTEEQGTLVPEVMTMGDIESLLLDPMANIDQDPTEAQLDIIRRILQAESMEEILGQASVTHARDYVNTPFALLSCKMQKSDFEGDGLKIYAVMECADNDGTPFVMTCGAAQVVAQAYMLQTRNHLPATVIVREKEKPTANGYKPMWLEEAKGVASF